jgi:uncharacterized protein (TIGR04255 family)
MTASVSSPTSAGTGKYREPPVHEVILAVTFDTPAAASALEPLPGLLQQLPVATRQEPVRMSMVIQPSGQPQISEERTGFNGWVLRDLANEPSRVLNCRPDHISYHVVRPGKWPSGPYPGWNAIAREFREIVATLQHVYVGLPIRRAGLRYLNRIALEPGEPLGRWFMIGFDAPSMLNEAIALHSRATWARVEGFDGLAVTMGLATIEIENAELKASGSVGLLFDIDVFNLYQHHAPRFETLNDWFVRAHAAERQLFEASITDALRVNFHRES